MGDPVQHSLSPLLHNAAFDEMGIDWVSVAFQVPAGETSRALEGMRCLGIGGLSVTTPHKEAAASAVDELSPLAQRLRATNCISRHGSTLRGESTDGAGFLEALRRGASFEPKGASCAVVGAGGAARAVILALAEAGASEVLVVNRTAERAVAAATLAGGVGRVANAEALSSAQLVVQATSVGFLGGSSPDRPSVAIDPRLLHAGQIVVDLIYQPAVTATMAAAKERGAIAIGGLGMLVHQAALAIEIWTEQEAPVDAMWSQAVELLREQSVGAP